VPIDATRRRELAAFYTAHHDRLRHAVARRAHGLDDATIDDACHAAWLLLLRRPDITLNARGLGWLQTVAAREAWALGARNRRETPAGPFRTPLGDADLAELPEPASRERSVEEQVGDRCQHGARLAALAGLKPRERQAVWLQGAGYSYHEIEQLTGASYTAVNRRITEGRAALRHAA
jgi:RNA polymerase sigma factor (sigma-70 family)